MAEDEMPMKEFEVFKDAIREENLEVQIEMTRSLGSLAKHLGEKITREELLPFIRENIDFHDEILLNLSEQLNHFVPLVGGYEHSQPILDILRKLCNTDETIVRAKTVETLKGIAQNLNSELTEELFLPMVETLSGEDWFTSKCSAVALYPVIYPKVREEKKTELRHTFRVLIRDESPIVRKAAAKSLVEMIPDIDKDFIKNEFIPVLDDIFDDVMDSVRANAVPIAIALAKRLTEFEVEESVFKIITSCAEDNSWKIRQILAHSIADVQGAIPHGKMRGRILSIFQSLVKDLESEVRIEIAGNITNYCLSLKKSYESQTEDNFQPVFQQSIVPQVILLSEDRNDDVRLALSRNILNLGLVVGGECFRQTILPIVIDFLERDHSMLIQANLLQNLDSLPDDIDITKSLSSIKKVVSSLIKNSQTHWRTRMSLLVAFLHIARFTKKEFFSENLKMSYATLLGDPVFAVRRTAPVILPLLAKQYGIAWATEHLIPYLKMFRKDSRYLYRFVPLFGILELIHPSVREKTNEKCLKDLKGFCSSENMELKKASARILLRVKKITTKLKEKLEEKTFRDVLSLNKSIDNFKNDNILLYSGDCMKIFMENRNSNIFSMDEKTVLERTTTYLEGLLSLIYSEFLELILNLFDDPIVNVQIRSIHVLDKVKQFTNSLSDELEEPWIADALLLLDDEESKTIEEEVEEEIVRQPVEPDEVEINTELMEDVIIDTDKVKEVVDFIDADTNIPDIKVEEVVDGERMIDDKKSDAKYEEVMNSVDTSVTGEPEPMTVSSSTADVPKKE